MITFQSPFEKEKKKKKNVSIMLRPPHPHSSLLLCVCISMTDMEHLKNSDSCYRHLNTRTTFFFIFFLSLYRYYLWRQDSNLDHAWSIQKVTGMPRGSSRTRRMDGWIDGYAMHIFFLKNFDRKYRRMMHGGNPCLLYTLSRAGIKELRAGRHLYTYSIYVRIYIHRLGEERAITKQMATAKKKHAPLAFSIKALPKRSGGV